MLRIRVWLRFRWDLRSIWLSRLEGARARDVMARRALRSPSARSRARVHQKPCQMKSYQLSKRTALSNGAATSVNRGAARAVPARRISLRRPPRRIRLAVSWRGALMSSSGPRVPRSTKASQRTWHGESRPELCRVGVAALARVGVAALARVGVAALARVGSRRAGAVVETMSAGTWQPRSPFLRRLVSSDGFQQFRLGHLKSVR
jgi:hypothetical protein